MFLQIHTLTSYPASLLNRDDAGQAKRIPWGGVTRTRISSQCLKRHWRVCDGVDAIREIKAGDEESGLAVRSRKIFDTFLRQPLVAEGIDPARVTAVVSAIRDEAYPKKAADEKEEAEGKKGNKRGKADEKEDTVDPKQIIALGRPEIAYLLNVARDLCKVDGDPKREVKSYFTKARRENLKALRLGSGIDTALFGRMATGDLLAERDASLHVAQAFTVHAESAEGEYFSAVDDLQDPSEGRGSAHLDETELTTGLYYGYVVLDVPSLVSNIEAVDAKDWRSADRSLAAETVRRLIRLVATVSPGAKRGATAPYAYANLVLVECGSAQPRSLANAFLRPVSQTPDVVTNAYEALDKYLGDLDRMYATGEQRRYAAVGEPDLASLDECDEESVDSVARWAAARVREG